MDSAVERLLDPSKSQMMPSSTVDDEYLAGQCPLLFAMMSVTNFNGSPRRTSTLLLFDEDGQFKICLNDRQRALVGFLTIDSTEDVFQQVEAALREEKIAWRPARASQNGRK